MTTFDLGAIVCDDGDERDAEHGQPGYGLATFKLDPGETVTCVFINVQRGTITIIKNAQPDSDAGLPLRLHAGSTACRLQPR